MAPNIRRATIHDASGIAKVHVDSWRTTYTGIVPQEYLDSLDYAARTELWKRQLTESEAHFLIAEDTGVLWALFVAENCASLSPNMMLKSMRSTPCLNIKTKASGEA